VLATLNEISGRPDGMVVRAALPIAAQPAFATTAARLEGFAQMVADAASGIVRVVVRGDDTVTLDAGRRAAGGGARGRRLGADRAAAGLAARTPARVG
jgi:hypothetical protein